MSKKSVCNINENVVSKDFIERMDIVQSHLDKYGGIYKREPSLINPFHFKEDIESVLNYLKTNYKNKKGLYIIKWYKDIEGIAVGSVNAKKMKHYLKSYFNGIGIAIYDIKEDYIEEQKEKLKDMKLKKEADNTIKGFEKCIVNLEEELIEFCNQHKEDLKLGLTISRIR